MSCISQKMSSIQPSPTVEITAIARNLKAKGANIIPLGIGETDFREPENVDEYAINAINQGKTKYPPLTGYPKLKEAIINKLKCNNFLDYSAEQIIVCNGVKQVLYNILTMTLDPEDEVIILSPYWVSYIEMVKIAEGKPVVVECKQYNDFKLDPKDLEKAITDKTKWIIFNSPNNPTGSCYTYDEIKSITDVLLKFPNVYLISDDIYEHIIYDEIKFYTPAQVEPKLYDRIVTVNGVSKAYSMTGWRVGYAAAGNKKIIQAMSILQSQSTSGVCSIAQYAAIGALNDKQDIFSLRAKTLRIRRDIALRILKTIPNLLEISFTPQGAFYLFISCKKLIDKKTPSGKTIKNSQDFAHYLLTEYHVVIIPGIAFGMENFFRLSYATEESLVKLGCEKIVEACKKLN
ncbi:MAG: pyridoxal phosphate-dependent aminotransferase [Rickettsiaceae bacterium H1]|nr:pyridoxal phosphate-dependent aminotransferase [Rickettsiaceae bacterium H1]